MITYKKGYKYQLKNDYSIDVSILNYSFDSSYMSLTTDGILTIKKGYAWDGPSGPTIDTKNFMRAALVHDALYQLMREHILPIQLRNVADDIMHKLCIEDGMSSLRAWYCYQAVKKFGEKSASERGGYPLITAP